MRWLTVMIMIHTWKNTKITLQSHLLQKVETLAAISSSFKILKCSGTESESYYFGPSIYRAVTAFKPEDVHIMEASIPLCTLQNHITASQFNNNIEKIMRTFHGYTIRKCLFRDHLCGRIFSHSDSDLIKRCHFRMVYKEREIDT